LNSKQSWSESVRVRLVEVRNRLAITGAGLLALVMAYHVLFGANGVISYRHKREESRELQQQIETLKQENEKIQSQIKALKDDPEAIEKEAREKLKYVRPGEVVYTLPASRATASPAPAK
jgi:cell division protein FtsB